MNDTKPKTRIQSSLNKELQSKSKIPVYTPKTYETSSVANTFGYIGVLGLGCSSTSGVKIKIEA